MGDHKSAIEVMKIRQSVRTYKKEKIAESDLNKIMDYMENEQNFIGPFGKTDKIQYVSVTNNKTDQGIKLGTYGFIKNPQGYLVGITENNQQQLLNFSYVFEKFVLYLTGLGLGTCWMGGTFNRHSFEQEIVMKEGDFIPCITPIGYPDSKPRLLDKALRAAVKADNKKAWEQLFFDSSFAATLTHDKAGVFSTPIEMVRLGPSASNKQPWRLILSEDRKLCHFYMEHTPNYSEKLGYDMQLLDMGIAMCHFELACKEMNIGGEWSIEEPIMDLPNDQVEYIVSWGEPSKID